MPTKEAVNVVLTLKEVSTCSLLISILLLCCFFSFSCTMMTHYHPSALTFQLFYIMGLPSVMTTDQGREFCNHVNKELMNVFGIQHRLTTVYHSQANGLDEHLNQTLVNSLAKFAQENRDTWDGKLPEVVYAYNKLCKSLQSTHRLRQCSEEWVICLSISMPPSTLMPS